MPAPSRSSPSIRLAALAALALLAAPAVANECAAITGDALRLACYDRLFRPPPDGGGELSIKGGEAPLPVLVAATDGDRAEAGRQALQAAGNAAQPGMIDAWDLDPQTLHAPFELRTYKPTYLLLGTYTDNINRQPSSGNPANTVSTPLDLLATEAQFQLSFKSKLWGNIFGDNGSLWAGYTQSSRWQVYSGGISRPFRETNYEPEAMLVFRTPYSLGSWHWRMTALSLNHQSNGRSNPLSRSWNRVIAHFGIERGDLSLQIRPWWRLQESDQNDDNPGIENYIGRGEIIVAQRLGQHVLSLQARHSLRSGEDSRGSLKLDWALPLAGRLKAHFSVFSGYGESLIDYNHRQTMVGAGISLVDW